MFDLKNQNIVFVMLDTVRADVLKAYGGEVRLRNIDNIARNGITYDMAIAPGTYTLPSHLSLFLGKRVRSIPGIALSGMKFNDLMTDPLLKKLKFAQGEVTLAKMMEYFGYKSALFSNNPFVSAPTGLANGFSHVSNIFVDKKLISSNTFVRSVLHLIQNDFTRKNLVRLAYGMSSVIPENNVDSLYLRLRKKLNRHFSVEYGYYQLDKGAAETNRQLKSYLARVKSMRNFIFLNYMEGHEGYPTNLFTKRYIEQDKWLHMIGEADPSDMHAMRYAYGKRLEYLDAKVADALGIMKEKGVLDDATVIICSDHGQAFMEHRQMFHNIFPYNEVSRVPLFIAEFKDGKQVRRRRIVEEPFSITDLNRLIAGNYSGSGIPVVSDHTGITEVWDAHLLKLFKERSKNANRIYKKKVELDRSATAIFGKRYKLIHHYGKAKDELYDMRYDIEERFNVIDSNRDIAHSLLELNSLAG